MHHEVFLNIGMEKHIERIGVRINEKKLGKLSMFVSSLLMLMYLPIQDQLFATLLSGTHHPRLSIPCTGSFLIAFSPQSKRLANTSNFQLYYL